VIRGRGKLRSLACFSNEDGGLNWEDLDKGAASDVPHHVAVIRPDELEKVYVGNDAGVLSWTQCRAPGEI